MSSLLSFNDKDDRKLCSLSEVVVLKTQKSHRFVLPCISLLQIFSKTPKNFLSSKIQRYYFYRNLLITLPTDEWILSKSFGIEYINKSKYNFLNGSDQWVTRGVGKVANDRYCSRTVVIDVFSLFIWPPSWNNSISFSAPYMIIPLMNNAQLYCCC
jgi:hypothetical protein